MLGLERFRHEGVGKPAPEWRVSEWFGSREPLSLGSLRGRVIALEAFQMLCPGCVSHGLPQAGRLRETFRGSDLAVVGLHTVFEHHEAMRPVSLGAFLYEYRVPFPVGVDAAAAGSSLPQTMAAYAMRGTPTLVLIDRRGIVRFHGFGGLEDMVIAANVATLLNEGA